MSFSSSSSALMDTTLLTTTTMMEGPLTTLSVSPSTLANLTTLASLAASSVAPATVEANTGGAASRPSAEYPYAMLGVAGFTAFFISVLGTFGNLLTIFALPMAKKLRTSATAFVVNLAVVELLFCVFILPMSGAQYLYLQQHDHSLLTDTDCIFFTVLRYGLTQVELQTILAIALTRAIAVSAPRLYSCVNKNSVMAAYICFIWVYSITIKLPAAFGVMGQYGFNEATMECDLLGGAPQARIAYLIIEAVVPVLVIFALYVFVFIMLKMSSARVARASCKAKVVPPSSSSTSTSNTTGAPPHNNRKGSNSSFRSLKQLVSEGNLRSRFNRQSSSVSQRLTTNRRDLRVARTIFVIFLLMLVCSVPVALVHLLDPMVRQPVRFLLLHMLYWLQYCFNLFVYVLLNRQYRDAYVDCLARVFPKIKRHHGRTFFWEKPSISSRPVPVASSRPGHKLDSSLSEGDAAPAAPLAATQAQGRLTAIPEGHSSSAANDSGFSDPQKKADTQAVNHVREEREAGDSDASDEEQQDHRAEDEPLVDQEHWVTSDGHMQRPHSDSESQV